MVDSKYSVLMSVYYKEKPEYLQASMESIYVQTAPADDFVLVCDGPLNDELDAVIERMQRKFGETLQVVRLEKNGGLGNALNVGIKYCKHELVARMDSDDISRPERCQLQLEVFQNRPEISILSGSVEEFSITPDIVDAKRILPELHNDIVEFAKKRNPFNHPCVMYRKSEVERAGGYQDFYLLEDYYLWIRMLLNGSKGHNLQEPLLWMRAGSDMYRRRAGLKYAKSQITLFAYMKEQGFISGSQCISSSLFRSVSSLLPNIVRQVLFERVLRG